MNSNDKLDKIMRPFQFFAHWDDICLGHSKKGKQNIYDCKASKSAGVLNKCMDNKAIFMATYANPF